MSWAIEARIEAGEAAWREGDLAGAIARLEPVVEAAPERPEAVFALARALHERGESERALALLDDALARPGAPRGGIAHRALVRFDKEATEELEEDLALLGAGNRTARALRALARLRAGGTREAVLPRAALWSAELAGRLLAILERARLETVAPADDTFHHRLWCAAPADPDSAPEPEVPSPWTREAWESALEATFAAGRFERFVRVWDDPEVPAAWREALRPEFRVYAAWAIAPAGEAVERARALAGTGPRPSVDALFLLGLAYLRAGRTPEAVHAFVRAARADDIQVHSVLTGLARELELDLRLEDD